MVRRLEGYYINATRLPTLCGLSIRRINIVKKISLFFTIGVFIDITKP